MNSEAKEILQGIFYQEPHSYMPEGLGLTLVVCLLVFVCLFVFLVGMPGGMGTHSLSVKDIPAL